MMAGSMQDNKGLKNGAEVSLTMGHLKRYVNDRLNTYIDAIHLGRSPVLLFHLVLAMGLLYVAENSGQMTKLLMAPYVAHLVLSRRIEYVPALILLSSGTTILSFVVLLSTMGVMLMNWRALMESALRPMVLVTTGLMAICLPMFLLWTVQDGANISALILNLDKFRFFFSIFPLFYGFLLLAPQGPNPQAPNDFRISKRFDLSIFSLPLSISFLLLTAGFPLVAGTNRILSMFAVLCLAYWALFVSLKPRVIAMPIHFYGLSVLYLGHTVLQANIKFNLIFSGLISFMLVFSMVRFHRETVKRWLSGRSIIVASLVFVAIGIYFSSRVDVELTDVDYSDVANYPQFMMQKLFADRGVIWAGAVDTILSSVGLFPQKEKILLQYETMAGELFEVDFGAHNIIFELILRLGWVVGFGLIVFLGQLLILLTRTLLQGQKDLHFLFAVALSLSLLLGGGLLGQYIMMPNFAYLMFTLAGLCLSYDNFAPAVREENMVHEDLVQENNRQDQRIHE
jgi:hypothetical protein